MTPHPERIAGYRILRVLDPAPNFADVFLGEQEVGNGASLAVIKWVRRLGSELEREVADREMKIGVNLEHDNIAKLEGHGTWEGRPYLLTEYLPGGTLQSLIEREGPLSWKRARNITADICLALHYAHSHPMLGTVVHRDLTPDNILFDASGRAKVIDYGIASAKFLQSRYGRSLFPMGKPRYMSLDQLTATEPGAATAAMDIFSLGAVLYEMLTKALPYGRDDEALAAQFAVLTGKQDAPGPKDLNPQISGWLNDAVKQALSPDPATRWASVREFSQALGLETAQEEKPARVTPKTRPETYPQRDAKVDRPERDQHSAGRQSIAERERAARSLDDWATSALEWKERGEDTRSRRCLTRAERLAENSTHWCSVAGYWKDILGDEYQARRCLTQAEKLALYSYNWSEVASNWKGILGDEHKARRCLEHAGEIAEGSYFLGLIAGEWTKILGDENEARRYLTRAEKLGRGCMHWGSIAEDWKTKLGDENESRRCLREAERAADERADLWCYVARCWKRILGDVNEAGRCLIQAERVARYSFDRGFIDDSWEYLEEHGVWTGLKGQPDTRSTGARWPKTGWTS